MAILLENQNIAVRNAANHWKSIYLLGGVTALLVILATLADIVIGTTLGGNLSITPQSAIDKFVQFQDNWLIGLYNLDFLNVCTAILLMPTYFALWAVHRRAKAPLTMLAMIIYFIGTGVFIANNAALPMLELSNRYFLSSSDGQKNLLLAAGEALLAKGEHGSLGAFLGFVLSSIASVVMSFGMLKGRIFSKTTAFLGIIGGMMLLVYLIFVTFVPEIKNIAVIVATPGGILALLWMILFTGKLFQLGRGQ